MAYWYQDSSAWSPGMVVNINNNSNNSSNNVNVNYGFNTGGPPAGAGQMYYPPQSTIGAGMPPQGQGYGFIQQMPEPQLSYAPPAPNRTAAQPIGFGEIQQLRELNLGEDPVRSSPAAQPVGFEEILQLQELNLGQDPAKKRAQRQRLSRGLAGIASKAQASSRLQPTRMQQSKFDTLLEDEDVYDINTYGSRGRVIIYVNKSFSDGEIRKGASADVQSLEELFGYLRYDVDVWENLTKQQLERRIEREKVENRSAYVSSDSFIFICMSHGTRGAICDTNYQPIEIWDNIVTRFDGKNCKELINKPKIFFVQACQNDPGTSGETSGVVSTDAAPVRRRHTIHEKSDIYVFMSTVPGYVSYRYTTTGSWFISALVESITQVCHTKDLFGIARQVRKKMGESTEDVKQLPEDRSTLQKAFYLPYLG